jgi:hypothetical protein
MARDGSRSYKDAPALASPQRGGDGGPMKGDVSAHGGAPMITGNNVNRGNKQIGRSPGTPGVPAAFGGAPKARDIKGRRPAKGSGANTGPGATTTYGP